MRQKTTTTFENNTLAVVSILSNADAGKLFKAISRYVTHGIDEKFPEGEVRILYALLKQQIDNDNAKFKQICETNSNNAKGAGKSNGKSKRPSKSYEGGSALAEMEAGVEIVSDKGYFSEKNERPNDFDEGLSFIMLESLYPKKDSTADFRVVSESTWNGLPVDEKRNAMAYVKSHLNDGKDVSNTYLSQFLKEQPWRNV